MRRLLSLLAGLLLVAVLILAGAAFVIQSRIDPEALRVRIQQQVSASTGRTLHLDAARLQLLPVPTLFASGIALAGLPSDPRPQMLTATSLSAHLALWPLLHHEARLEGLTLQEPDLLLRRDADGHANWQFHKPDHAAGPGSTPSGTPWRTRIGSLRLRDGTVSWQDEAAGWSGTARLDRLDATGLSGDHPAIELAGGHGNGTFTATLRSGALDRLLDGAAPPQSAWPAHLFLRTSRNNRVDTELTVDGTIADPARLRGFTLDVRLDAPHPDGLDALFPHAGIPATGPVSLDTRVIDNAPESATQAAPSLQRLALRASGVDVGAALHHGWSQGLRLDRLAVNAADPAAAVALDAGGDWRGRPVSLHGTAGTLQSWHLLDTTRQGGDTPFDLMLHAGDAAVALNGKAGPGGGAADVQATIPLLRAFLPVGPALTGLSVHAAVSLDRDRHVAVHGLSLDSHELAVAGDATIAGGTHPSIDATISSGHLDLDALRSGWVDAPLEPNSGSTGAPTGDAADARSNGTAPVVPAPILAPTATPAVPPGEHAIPFARLSCCDAAIRFTANAMRFDGADYSAVAATLALHGGALVLSPASASGPAGPIAFALQADGGARSISLDIQPSMLPATTLARWLGRPPVLDGNAELVAQLKGSGPSWEAQARTAEGHVGLSMVDGSIADAALGQLIGRPQAAAAGAVPGRPDGRTGFRCLALPATIGGGTATLDPIALSTSRLVVQGRGTVTLPDGRLDLHLTPRLAIGATGASLPVRIGGTLEAPEAALDPAAPGGRFSLSIGGSAPPDPCGAALAAARFGANGPAPGNVPEGRHKAPKPIDILRGLGLFR